MDSPIASTACALCDELFEIRGDSKEHIIPNSLGGRKKVSGFICRSCNSLAGETWDAEIWRQFSHIAMIHGVERDRAGPPSIAIQTIDGAEYSLLADGTMTIPRVVFEVEPTETGKRLHIAARDATEARRLVRQAAKKNPSIDVDSLMDGMCESETYLESPVVFTASLGGELACRSMIKSAVALAVASGVSALACGNALAFLKDTNAVPPHANFYLRDLVSVRPTDHAFNCVSVSGDPHRRLLLGYIEYFSMWRLVVILSDAYDGPPVKTTYAFNPATGAELELKLDLTLSESEIDAVRSNDAMTDETFAAAMNAGFGVVHKRDQLRNQQRETLRAFQRTAEAMGIPWGGEIPQDRAEEFASLMAEQLMPWLTSIMRR